MVNCKKHGVVAAVVPWARHNSRFTKEFEQMTAWLAMKCTKVAVSALMRVSWNTIGPIISQIRNELDPDPTKHFGGLERIGVDETSYKKRHKYNTIIVNHDTGR